ncbi:uncharacterized protein [Ambystoma mexicanum]|uniref:uncharacterized protein n=1 Tax=Ambystoma mexicanum TaxID=8296 RepID=UPI0037E878A8
MATRFSALQREVTCSICWEYFTDPVTLECGHNFCSACICTFWENAGQGGRTCPQCRKECARTQHPRNLQLANLVGIARQLSAPRGVPGELCEWHEEQLKLFCEEDQQAVCTICDRSREHRGHSVIPVEEALQQYKLKILSRLDDLKAEMGNILNMETKERENILEFKASVEREKQKIASEFEEMNQFLEEQKQMFLSQLEEEEKEIVRRLEESISMLTEQSASLKALITEKEDMCQQSSVHLLKDARSFLNRPESEKPEAVPRELSAYTCSVPLQQYVASKMVERFRETQQEELRFVLVGEAGIGKRVQECIISDYEASKPEAIVHPLATVCEKRSCCRGGRTMTLVNTPGLLSGAHSQEALAQEIGQCVVVSSPGPHAIILALSVGHITGAQEEAVRIVQDVFGEGALKYTIIVFVREDGLKKEDIQSSSQESKEKLKEMMAKCGHRFCTIDISATGEKSEGQVAKLITAIDRMVLENGGRCYANAMWDEANKELQKKVEEIKKRYREQFENEEAEIRHLHKKRTESLKKEPEGPEKSTQLQELDWDLKVQLEEAKARHTRKQIPIQDEAQSELLQSIGGKMHVAGPLGMVIGAAMGKVVGGPMGMFVGGPVGILVGGALGGAVGGAVGGAMGDAVGATVKMFKGLLDMK